MARDYNSYSDSPWSKGGYLSEKQVAGQGDVMAYGLDPVGGNQMVSDGSGRTNAQKVTDDMMKGDISAALSQHFLKKDISPGEDTGPEGPGRIEAKARTVAFNPQGTDAERFRATAYDRDYYDPNAAENRYVQQNLNDLANHYGRYGQEVQRNISSVVPGAGSKSLGNFAKVMRADKPMENISNKMLDTQYKQRFAGEKKQTAGQRDWTLQARELAMKKALAERAAAQDVYSAREGSKVAQEESGMKPVKDVFQTIGMLFGGKGK